MAGLLGAARRHRRGVEEQHDRAVGEQRCEASHSARLVGQFEFGYPVTTFHECHATPATAGIAEPVWEDYHVQTTANLAVTTTREDFRALAAEHRVVPVTRKVLADSETPLSAYRKLAANRPGHVPARVGGERAVVVAVVVHRRGRAVGVHGARRRGGLARRHARRTRRAAVTRCRRCARRWSCCRPNRVAGLPPLSGGMVGFFAYDLVRRLERLPELAVDDLELPDMVLLLATDIAAVDHHEGTITLIANAVNWNGTDERVDGAYDDAVARLDVMTDALGSTCRRRWRRSAGPSRCTARSARSRSTARSSSGSSARSRQARRSRWCRRSGSRWTPTPTRSTCTGCCGCPTPARTCTC